MLCTKCGKDITESSNFCPNCGAEAGGLQTAAKAAPPLSELNDSNAPRLKHAQSKASRVGRAVISVILSFMFLGFLTAASLLTITKPQNITEAVSQTDITAIVDTSALIDSFMEETEYVTIGAVHIYGYNIKEFVRLPNVRKEAGIIAKRYVEALIRQDYEYHISSRDITQFLRGISPDIRDEFGISLSNADYEIIERGIKRESLKPYNAGWILAQTGADFRLVSAFLSEYPFMITAILCGLATFNIFITNRRNIGAAFLYAGVPMFLCGFAYIAAWLTFGVFSGSLSRDMYTASAIIAGFVRHLGMHGSVLTGVGALMIALAVIIKKITKPRHNETTSDTTGGTAFRAVCLTINLAVLSACVVLSVLLIRSLPEASISDRYIHSNM